MMRKGTRRRPRTARWQKTAALLPLVMLSGALSANATTDRDELSAASAGEPGAPTVPSTAFEQPASVSLPGAMSSASMSGLTAGLAPESSFDFFSGDAPSDFRGSQGFSQNVSAAGIPASALTAYQRAAAILNQADPACNLDWTLVAGIGKVESDHGRYGGNALDAQGKAQPGIYGLPLNGSNGTARITDTDNGVYDDDPVYDRAVGPMQFIPGTWEVAGVDADQDGAKDPQDIDDAATASAVYLCAGSDDLSTDAGQRAAVYRYNRSNDYVDLVLSIAASYAGGEFTAVPNGTPSSSTLVPQDFAADGRPAKGTRNRPAAAGGGSNGGSTSGGTASGGSVSGSDGADGGSSGGGAGGDSGSDGSDGDSPDSGSPDGGSPDDGDNDNESPDDGDDVTPEPDEDPVGDAVDQTRKTVKDTTDKVTKPEPSPSADPTAEAREYCAGQPLPLSKCVDAYLSGGSAAVKKLLGGVGGGL